MVCSRSMVMNDGLSYGTIWTVACMMLSVMELCLLETTTGLNPEPDESNQYPDTKFLKIHP
jgi:hypothetical protein